MLPSPEVVPVKLERSYDFMYDVSVFSDQSEVYLFLEHQEGGVHALVFNGTTFKFGAPNDETIGGHPLVAYGLGPYDFFEVINSPWIEDLRNANRVHPRHSDALFSGRRHFIATFKDVTFEVVCRGFQERQLSREDLQAVLAAAVPGFGQG